MTLPDNRMLFSLPERVKSSVNWLAKCLSKISSQVLKWGFSSFGHCEKTSISLTDLATIICAIAFSGLSTTEVLRMQKELPFFFQLQCNSYCQKHIKNITLCCFHKSSIKATLIFKKPLWTKTWQKASF